MELKELECGERVAVVGDFVGVEEGYVGEEERGDKGRERRGLVRRERDEGEERGSVFGDGERWGGRGGARVEV